MSKKPHGVTPAELSVMQQLWRRAPQTIREISNELSPRNANSYYATVKKLLERLEAKGFVRRHPQGIAFEYEPTINRDEMVGQRLDEVSQTLCDGSVSPLLTQLSQHHLLNRNQQKVLLKLIEDLEKQEQKKANKRKNK